MLQHISNISNSKWNPHVQSNFIAASCILTLYLFIWIKLSRHKQCLYHLTFPNTSPETWWSCLRLAASRWLGNLEILTEHKNKTYCHKAAHHKQQPRQRSIQTERVKQLAMLLVAASRDADLAIKRASQLTIILDIFLLLQTVDTIYYTFLSGCGHATTILTFYRGCKSSTVRAKFIFPTLRFSLYL